MDMDVPAGGYATDVYDLALAEQVEAATIHALRSAEGQALLRAMAPVRHCSAEMQQFYWLVFMRLWRLEAKRVPGDQEVPAVPGQEDGGL